MLPNTLNAHGVLSRHFHDTAVLFDITRVVCLHSIHLLTHLSPLTNFLPDMHAVDHLLKQDC